RFEPPLQHPLRLFLLVRDQANDVFGQSRRSLIRFNVGDEAVLIFLIRNLFDRSHRHFAWRARSRFSITAIGMTPRARSLSVTCSNALVIARLMPNLNRRDGHAMRIAQTAWHL